MRGTGVTLAEGDDKVTGYVRATVCPARVVSPKYVPLFTTVRLLGCFPLMSRVVFLWWPNLSASTSAHGQGNSACSAVATRSTILLVPRKAVPKAQHDAFEHVCEKQQHWSSN